MYLEHLKRKIIYLKRRKHILLQKLMHNTRIIRGRKGKRKFGIFKDQFFFSDNGINNQYISPTRILNYLS